MGRVVTDETSSATCSRVRVEEVEEDTYGIVRVGRRLKGG